MALATYSDLKSTVADFLNRTDLTSVIPTFILLAEAKIRRVLRGAVARTTITVSGNETQLPADFQEAVSLYHNSDPYHRPLKMLSPDELSNMRTQLPAAGVPAYAAILNRVLLVAPTPQDDFTLDLAYYADLEPLSDTQATNWVMTDHPDVYLSGTLAEAEPYLKNDERIGIWRDQFLQGLNDISLKYDRQHYGANTPAIRPLRAIG